jgi:predicted PurR-regulated permease PerM
MDTSYTSDLAGLGAIMAFMGVFIFILLAVAVVMYIFSALALYKMASNRNINNPWFAWIPFLNLYLMGEIIDQRVYLGELEIPYAQLVLPLGSLAVGLISSLLGAIPYIGAIIAFILPIAWAIYVFAAVYRLYKLYKPGSAVLYLILSIIFSILQPIFMFTMRNNEYTEYK